MNSLLMAC